MTLDTVSSAETLECKEKTDRVPSAKQRTKLARNDQGGRHLTRIESFQVTASTKGRKSRSKNGSERTTGQKRNEMTEKTGKSKTQNPPSPDVQTWPAVLPAVFGERAKPVGKN